MPPMKSEKPAKRAGAKPRLNAEDKRDPPQKLNLGCGTLIMAITIIALLGTFLPHEPRHPSASAQKAAKPGAKPEESAETDKTTPRHPAIAALKPAGSQKKQPVSEPIRPGAGKTSGKPVTQTRSVVFNDPWTGSVSQVEHYLKRNLHDAASFEALEWGPVADTRQGYRVKCTYRAKNLLGVYATQTRTFLLNRNGDVVAVREKD